MFDLSTQFDECPSETMDLVVDSPILQYINHILQFSKSVFDLLNAGGCVLLWSTMLILFILLLTRIKVQYAY